MYREKIRIDIPKDLLSAYESIFYKIDHCGKAVLFPHTPMKFTDETFRCVYSGALASREDVQRFPSKTGKLYKQLEELVQYFDLEYKRQRGKRFDL